MSVEIRLATSADIPSIFTLIKDLAEFEGEADAVEVTEESLAADMALGRFHVFLAHLPGEADGSIAGMAFWYYRMSTWKGRTIHLEDLVVRAEHRRKGVGSALYDRVMQQANLEGIKRVEYAVLNWNTNAIALYEKKKATLLRDWITVQCEGEQLRSFGKPGAATQ
eukprot:CAMPEP_0170747398 /NCGR_PEP_ID=MMETSP0437-20130122/9299_1 /TAXON_ID=0 /ORGANISM="Sexangularia sp." /LENGTH=165 /DNA_ID=CAMNT_0011086169 /DNA_START=75 /DNA_END=572 /DNA_ORIENTATION=+